MPVIRANCDFDLGLYPHEISAYPTPRPPSPVKKQTLILHREIVTKHHNATFF